MVIGTAVALYQGYKVYDDAKKYGTAASDLYRLAKVPSLAGLQRAGNSLVEIIGLENIVASLVKHGVRLALRSHEADAGTMDEMLALMRERVPRDTVRLYNGISGEIEDGVATVTASAIRVSGSGKKSIDYAFLVEHGTQAGVRGRSQQVADANYFAVDMTTGTATRRRPTRSTRRSQRTHPGTPAQPFFYNSAREVLERRQERMEAAADAAAEDAGLS